MCPSAEMTGLGSVHHLGEAFCLLYADSKVAMLTYRRNSRAPPRHPLYTLSGIMTIRRICTHHSRPAMYHLQSGEQKVDALSQDTVPLFAVLCHVYPNFHQSHLFDCINGNSKPFRLPNVHENDHGASHTRHVLRSGASEPVGI